MTDHPEDVAGAARALLRALERELEPWVAGGGAAALDGLEPEEAAELLERARGVARAIAGLADRLDAVAERRRTAPAPEVVEHRVLASALGAWMLGERWQAILRAGLTPDDLAARLRVPPAAVAMVLALRELPQAWTERLAGGDPDLAGLSVPELLDAAARDG